MINKTKQTAVYWFSNQAYELFEQYSEGNFDRITLNKLMLAAAKEAEEMEKEQIEHAYGDGRIPVIAVTRVTSKQYYEQTYGGNK